MKVVLDENGSGRDYTFFVSSGEVAVLRTGVVSGELYSQEFPFESFGRSLQLRMAESEEPIFRGGGRLMHDDLIQGFYLAPFSHQKLEETGLIGIRYDDRSNKLFVQNYEKRSERRELLLKNLGLFGEAKNIF